MELWTRLDGEEGCRGGMRTAIQFRNDMEEVVEEEVAGVRWAQDQLRWRGGMRTVVEF